MNAKQMQELIDLGIIDENEIIEPETLFENVKNLELSEVSMGGPGAPRKYRPSLGKMLVQYAGAAGGTHVKFAEFLGISVSTFHKWRNEYPEFDEYVTEADELAANFVEDSLYARAVGRVVHDDYRVGFYEGSPVTVKVKKHYPPDQKSIEFYLRNRAARRWKDEKHIKHALEDPAQALRDAKARVREGRVIDHDESGTET